MLKEIKILEIKQPKRKKNFRERQGCRKRLYRLMEEQNLSLVEIAPSIIGRNMKKQTHKMLLEHGYSEQQVEEIMKTNNRRRYVEKLE